MRLKHPKRWWTPRYLYLRLLRIWYNWRHQDEPWMNRRAIAYMAAKIKPGDVGFEWGAGRSTIWFSKRCKRLYSVEHNPRWLARVQESMARSGISNVEISYHGDGAGNNKSYPDAIDSFEDVSFDFILVDGKARDECAFRAVSKLKPGGILIIDDAHRTLPSEVRCYPRSRRLKDGPANRGWAKFVQMTQDWAQEWHSDGITATAVFTKPLVANAVEGERPAAAAGSGVRD